MFTVCRLVAPALCRLPLLEIRTPGRFVRPVFACKLMPRRHGDITHRCDYRVQPRVLAFAL